MIKLVSDENAPVIGIDGPAGCGKGLARHSVAEALGWNELDSGVLYRLVPFRAYSSGIKLTDIEGLTRLAEGLDVRMEGGRVFFGRRDITDEVRSDEMAEPASIVAKIPEVRKALLKYQLNCRQKPGLVADGRDMTTVVFKDSPYKIYITADLDVRARWRLKDLKERNKSADFDTVRRAMSIRDELEAKRDESPLYQHPEACLVDATNKTPLEVMWAILTHVSDKMHVAGKGDLITK